ncbi:LexA family protein [Arundinibacter roseus]|uniref:Translesion error-prone DNA polymerase V autoproteolytic subunit n=1 Tax=Arundinibacter roseus TaxID=2070510 RepID=A0A4R4KFX1_9BACT|nr:translesion error-prone DNA polymerase V autoproteolytic subunit [Arundinibacter roseus]TDB66838.1 translesion error-prone DNA polymerase V autoproteolytic subunit [Arundinibacter roseus]
MIDTYKILLPLYVSPIQAGFPSPADDYIELELNLNEHLIQNPSATFCVKVKGNSMEGANIHAGDILLVDRSKPATSGKVVVAVLNGEFTVKRLLLTEKGTYLVPEHPAYKPIPISEDSEFQIWGVVTYTIHKH